MAPSPRPSLQWRKIESASLARASLWCSLGVEGIVGFLPRCVDPAYTYGRSRKDDRLDSVRCWAAEVALLRPRRMRHAIRQQVVGVVVGACDAGHRQQLVRSRRRRECSLAPLDALVSQKLLRFGQTPRADRTTRPRPCCMRTTYATTHVQQWKRLLVASKG